MELNWVTDRKTETLTGTTDTPDNLAQRKQLLTCCSCSQERERASDSFKYPRRKRRWWYCALDGTEPFWLYILMHPCMFLKKVCLSLKTATLGERTEHFFSYHLAFSGASCHLMKNCLVVVGAALVAVNNAKQQHNETLLRWAPSAVCTQPC